ncbi:hypothetical protein [Streptomyces xanthophaeus]|uniref:hypothetical protein n=1 Tax=Streptomyces xanthophaeus TaxID=67385 RepID=UPI0026495380|nr:hypothetical protein [Streptomyces xanthophaeus]WKD36629.1 hypothetical protein KO717_34965 [Streptomyces xanthophaeus]
MPSSPSALTDLWLRGVAANTGAPAGVLLRLLDPAAGEARRILCEMRPLPQEVMDAAIAHPDHKVRRPFARNPTSHRPSAPVWSMTPTASSARVSPVDPARACGNPDRCPTTPSYSC